MWNYLRSALAGIKRLGPDIAKVVLVSTALALGTVVFTPLLKVGSDFVRLQAHRLDVLYRPHHLWVYLALIAIPAFFILFCEFLPKLWRSLRLGLVELQFWTWTLACSALIVLFEWHHVMSGLLVLIAAGYLSSALSQLSHTSTAHPKQDTYETDPDLPLLENGKDLLGRDEIINYIADTIIRERPSVIALTGNYGAGKTSALNLAIGKLRKLDSEQRPIIVKFSPWLPENSTGLVLSLFSSIMAEIRRDYIVSGLSQSFVQYARVLLNVIPKGEALKELFKDASQDGRIKSLVDYIAKMPRRILVVLDDLDRMQARELETIFKILRGSEELSRVTFVCCFDIGELASILKTTRKFQETDKFIEKFFQTRVALPPIDSTTLKELFQAKMVRIREKYQERTS